MTVITYSLYSAMGKFIMDSFNKLTSKIKKSFKDALYLHLPRKTKRLIYVASLYAFVTRTDNPDDSIGEKLEMLFELGKQKESYVFPMIINSVIWREIYADAYLNIEGKDFCLKEIKNTKLTKIEKSFLVKHFEANTPYWLRYGSEQLLQHDANIILSELNSFA